MKSGDASRFVLLLFIALVFMGGGVCAYILTGQDGVLAKRQCAVSGRIIAHVGQGRSSRIIYSYSANGAQYETRESCWDDVAPCLIGKEVKVYYDPLDPHNSLLMDFGRRREKTVREGAVAFAIGAILTGITLVLMRNAKKSIEED